HPTSLSWFLRSFPTRRSSDLVVPVGDLLRQPVLDGRHRFTDALLAPRLDLGEVGRDERHRRMGERLRLQVAGEPGAVQRWLQQLDRKSTRLNSSHVKTSYAVF